MKIKEAEALLPVIDLFQTKGSSLGIQHKAGLLLSNLTCNGELNDTFSD
jgi:hypothetical protein